MQVLYILNFNYGLLCQVFIENRKLTKSLCYPVSLNPSLADPRKRKKLNLNFIFELHCGPSKGFVNALTTLIKPLDAPQRNVKMKILVNFCFKAIF